MLVIFTHIQLLNVPLDFVIVAIIYVVSLTISQFYSIAVVIYTHENNSKELNLSNFE